MADENSLDSIFNKRYVEFCNDLIETYEEKAGDIRTARDLSEEQRIARFRAEVVPTAGNPNRNPLENPGTVLPGVRIEDSHWTTFSEKSKKAIQEYITLLSFCCVFHDSSSMWNEDLSGAKAGPMKQMMEKMMEEWKSRLNTVDFKALSEKILNIFGGAGGAGAKGFTLPDRILKGQLAKLAEELVREFKPEDFGLSPEQLEETEKNPSRAFELLMSIYTQRPEILQNAMKRITKRLQDKVRRGELRPQELAAEAEEMMKEFSENPAFVELMETFRSVFGFEDQETARAAGRDGDGRLALARQRLRAKLDAKKKGVGKGQTK
jgi:hypothetical protein